MVKESFGNRLWLLETLVGDIFPTHTSGEKCKGYKAKILVSYVEISSLRSS